MLGLLSLLTTIGLAIAAGLNHLSFWWCLIPAFFAATFSVANNEAKFAAIMRANEEGRLGVMPTIIGTNMLVLIAFCGVAYWITRWVT